MKRLLLSCDMPPAPGGQARYFGGLWDNLPSDEFLMIVPPEYRGDSGTIVARTKYARGETAGMRLLRLHSVVYTAFTNAIKHGPDEFHAGQLVVGGIAGLLLKKLLKIPYVLYIFGADLLEFERKRWFAPLLRAILNNSRLIITISDFTAAAIVKNAPKAAIVKITPGVEDRYFTRHLSSAGALRQSLGLSEKKILLTVGRLVERKGHDSVIRALSGITARLPGLMYLIAGDGPQRAVLESLVAQLNLQESVRFCGFVDDGDLPQWYAMADLFVMTPRELTDKGDAEGFGMVYLEANAAGVPVIASRSGGVADAVKNNVSGILLDGAADTAQLAEAIAGLMTDDSRRASLSQSARAHARTFMWPAIRQAWLDSIRS